MELFLLSHSFIWLYVIIMSHTHFKVNLHSQLPECYIFWFQYQLCFSCCNLDYVCQYLYRYLWPKCQIFSVRLFQDDPVVPPFDAAIFA